jgi:DNA topoisomerase-1
MHWKVLTGAEARLPAIAAAVRAAPRVLLASDPDREGEAIAWHLKEELKERKALNSATPTQRIMFTEGVVGG